MILNRLSRLFEFILECGAFGLPDALFSSESVLRRLTLGLCRVHVQRQPVNRLLQFIDSLTVPLHLPIKLLLKIKGTDKVSVWGLTSRPTQYRSFWEGLSRQWTHTHNNGTESLIFTEI